MAHESLPPGHQGSPTFKLLCNKTPIWRLNSKRCLLLTVRKWKPYFADMDKASSSILKSIILKFQVPVDCHNRNHLYPICGGSAVKKKKTKTKLSSNAGDLSSAPGSGRSPGEENGNPLPYSCLENPMDRGARWQQSLRSKKSQTQLNV